MPCVDEHVGAQTQSAVQSSDLAIQLLGGGWCDAFSGRCREEYAWSMQSVAHLIVKEDSDFRELELSGGR